LSRPGARGAGLGRGGQYHGGPGRPRRAPDGEAELRRLLLALALLCTPVSAAWSQQVLNLRDADIRAFIQDAARVTGRTFIIDPAVQGRAPGLTRRPVPTSEDFGLFLAPVRPTALIVSVAGA